MTNDDNDDIMMTNDDIMMTNDDIITIMMTNDDIDDNVYNGINRLTFLN